MNRFLKAIWLFFTGVLILGSCQSEDDLPDEPKINSIQFMKSDTSLVLEFTDGDGNFGLRQGDTLPPFQPYEDEEETIRNRFHNNYWLDIYVKREGEFVLFEPVNSENAFDFRIPEITPQGQNKQLRVKVTNDLSLELKDLIESSSNDIFLGDTVKFSVELVDRDLNVSGPAETGEVVLEF